jgi:hypothetical protein
MACFTARDSGSAYRGSLTYLPATGGNEQVAPVHLTLSLRSYMVPRFIQSDSHR